MSIEAGKSSRERMKRAPEDVRMNHEKLEEAFNRIPTKVDEKGGGLRLDQLAHMTPEYFHFPADRRAEYLRKAEQLVAEEYGVKRPSLEDYAKGNDLTNVDIRAIVQELVDRDLMAYAILMRKALYDMAVQEGRVEELNPRALQEEEEEAPAKPHRRAA